LQSNSRSRKSFTPGRVTVVGRREYGPSSGQPFELEGKNLMMFGYCSKELKKKTPGNKEVRAGPILRQGTSCETTLFASHARCNLPSRWMHFVCTTPPLLGPSFAPMRLSREADSKKRLQPHVSQGCEHHIAVFVCNRPRVRDKPSNGQTSSRAIRRDAVTLALDRLRQRGMNSLPSRSYLSVWVGKTYMSIV
jgi:hypothetical protein